MTKREIELFVAESFCEAYTRLNGTICGVLRAGEDPPDVYIVVNETEIALELAGYREQGAHNEAQERDQRAKRRISDSWMIDSSVQEFSPSLKWRQTEDERFIVPKIDTETDQLIVELKQLIHHKAKSIRSTFTDLILKPQSELATYRKIDRRSVYEAAETYPMLARYCTGVRIQHHPGVFMTVPGSNLNARFTGLDRDEITNVVTTKLGKLPSYRAAAQNRPVWLLLYGMFWPPTARIPHEGLIDEVLELIRATVADNPEKFDEIWWGQDLGVNSATVHRAV